jgi:hypothetical protein
VNGCKLVAGNQRDTKCSYKQNVYVIMIIKIIRMLLILSSDTKGTGMNLSVTDTMNAMLMAF